jgi:hypothetical protein
MSVQLERFTRKIDRTALRADLFKLLGLTVLFALAVLLTT